MKNLKYLFSLVFFVLPTQIYAATGDAGILGGAGDGSMSAADKLRQGDIHVDDIPGILTYAIDYLMGFAGTISIIFIILGAFKIALGSLDNDKSKGKDMVKLAIYGFILSSLSWVILKVVIDNFG